LKHTKKGKFEKALESQYADERGIVKAHQILREEAGKTDFNAQWHKLFNELHDAKELGKEEGIALGKALGKEEFAKRLLDRGMTDKEIATITDLSVEEIEDLRRRIQKSDQ
jgi:predicted transposase/invertase (TIGR01784 family)